MSEIEHIAASGMPPIIVINVSGDGLNACVALLRGLPPWLTAAIVVRADGHPSTADALRSRLRSESRWPVRSLGDNDPVMRRTVHLLPPDRLAGVDAKGRFRLLPSRARGRPTLGLDPLLYSLATVADASTVLVMLGSHASDGLHGARRLVQVGGAAIFHDVLRTRDPRDVGAWILPASRIAAALAALTLMPGARRGCTSGRHRTTGTPPVSAVSASPCPQRSDGRGRASLRQPARAAESTAAQRHRHALRGQ